MEKLNELINRAEKLLKEIINPGSNNELSGETSIRSQINSCSRTSSN